MAPTVTGSYASGRARGSLRFWVPVYPLRNEVAQRAAGATVDVAPAAVMRFSQCAALMLVPIVAQGAEYSVHW